MAAMSRSSSRRAGPALSLDLAPKEQSTLSTIGALLPYLWPKGETGSHIRVIIAAAFLIAAKVATVYVPLVYSHIIDALAPKSQPMLALPIALVLGYGLLRVASAGFAELPVAATLLVELGCSPVIVEGGLLRDDCAHLFQEWREAGLSQAY